MAIHRGRFKTLSKLQRKWSKRRQAIEPAIGHTKSDHRMDRRWLQSATGDALHAVLCAAGYNIRWLLRAIARGGLRAAFLRLLGLWTTMVAAPIGRWVDVQALETTADHSLALIGLRAEHLPATVVVGGD